MYYMRRCVVRSATASTTGITITVGAVTLSTVGGVQVRTIDITAT